MIKEVIKNYGSLCDSWIDEISIKKQVDNSKEKHTIIIGINCANIIKNHQYERIILTFTEIIEFIVKDNSTFINLSPQEVFIKIEHDKILFDFDPIDNFDYLEENNDSNFKIISKGFSFKKEN